MKRLSLALAAAASLATAGCDRLTPQQQIAAGALLGAGAGLLTANALKANSSWTLLTALAGAAAGTLVARNLQTGECAYANGDGTYYTAPCG